MSAFDELNEDYKRFKELHPDASKSKIKDIRYINFSFGWMYGRMRK